MNDPRIAISIGGLQIHWYGIIIACGLAVGAVLGVREARRKGY
jgi:phosphatidylglycerol:prolipoprotein diacylglycerol transferase